PHLARHCGRGDRLVRPLLQPPDRLEVVLAARRELGDRHVGQTINARRRCPPGLFCPWWAGVGLGILCDMKSRLLLALPVLALATVSLTACTTTSSTCANGSCTVNL